MLIVLIVTVCVKLLPVLSFPSFLPSVSSFSSLSSSVPSFSPHLVRTSLSAMAPSSSPSLTTLPPIGDTRSKSDEKQYRQVILPNGLQAVLVQDTTAMRTQLLDDYNDENDDSVDSESADGASADGDSDDGDSDDDGKYRKAALSLTVGCGSFLDPPNLQGLAHYLEHMLFMGSRKYPGENAYDEYLSRRGGESNAYTECEETVFHFEVDQGRPFEEAADR